MKAYKKFPVEQQEITCNLTEQLGNGFMFTRITNQIYYSNLVDISCLPHLDCGCDEVGRENNTCTKDYGICLFCKHGFDGDKCQECDTHFTPTSGDDKCTQCIESYYGGDCDLGTYF